MLVVFIPVLNLTARARSQQLDLCARRPSRIRHPTSRRWARRPRGFSFHQIVQHLCQCQNQVWVRILPQPKPFRNYRHLKVSVTPAWGSPAGRRVRRWLSTAKEEHVCAHVWACLACVCCGCVCGSGVRRQTHLSSRLVAVTASHMRGPGEGWGRGRVFPPSMPHSEPCEIR